MFSRSSLAKGQSGRGARVAMAELAQIRHDYWLANPMPCVFGHKTTGTGPQGGST